MVKLLNTRIFIGANIHCGFPAVAGQLEITAASADSAIDRIAGLERYFTDVVPELAYAGFPPSSGGTKLPVDPRAAIAMTVARLAARLQNLADGDVSDIEVHQTGAEEVFALCGYQLAEVAVQAIQLAFALFAAGWPNQGSSPDEAGLKRRVAEFIAFALSRHFDQTTRVILSAARARRIPHFRISPSSRFVQLGQGIFRDLIFESVSDRTSQAGSKIAHNKAATHDLLCSLGVPVPSQAAVTTYEQAAEVVRRMGFPLVVKPSHGAQGKGVTVGIRNRDELYAAIQLAAEAGLGSVLIEKYVPGNNHRLLLVDGKLVAAAKLIFAHVVGDGRHSIEQLIAIANQDPRRGEGFGKELTKIPMNAETSRMLAGQRYDYSSVPPERQVVLLHGTGNTSAGSTAVDVTGTVHPEVREMAELITRAFKLDVAGIDYLTEDISRSFRDAGGAVCEVNACPGLRALWGAGVDRQKILGAILALHYPDGQTGRIPVVAIAGGSGKAAASRMLAAILEASGKTTALAASGGVSVGKRKVLEGRSAGGIAARAVLMDPDSEAAVIEIDCADLIAEGVPFDACDVAAVLHVPSGHAGRDGIHSMESLAEVMRLVPGTASRYTVLNADDPHCVKMAEHLRAVPVCWVSLDPGKPLLKAHAGSGGLAVALSGTGKDADIVAQKGGKRQVVARICDIPSARDGTETLKLTNALFAVAIACALDIPMEHVRAGLKSFLMGD